MSSFHDAKDRALEFLIDSGSLYGFFYAYQPTDQAQGDGARLGTYGNLEEAVQDKWVEFSDRRLELRHLTWLLRVTDSLELLELYTEFTVQLFSNRFYYAKLFRAQSRFILISRLFGLYK